MANKLPAAALKVILIISRHFSPSAPPYKCTAGRDRRRAEQSDGFFMHVIREMEGGEDAAQTADIDNIQRLS